VVIIALLLDEKNISEYALQEPKINEMRICKVYLLSDMKLQKNIPKSI